ncbi:MAG: hypothetical protein J7539_07190 [Niabella sp.]|nr:hypothetical protein [Niabella sp.]
MTHTYFQLQFKLLNRHIKDFGLSPLWGWLLGTIIFILGSKFLFARTSYAGFLYLFIAGSFLLNLSNRKRNRFLKGVFSRQQFSKIRFIENGVVALPFIIFLLFKQDYLFALGVVILSTALSFFNYASGFNKALPTPYGKRPFEFLLGFRQYILAIIAAWLLTGIAIFVTNFNLALVSFAGLFLLSVSFYSTPEELIYLWNFNRSPRAFLAEKAQTALLQVSVLSFVPLIALLIVFPGKWWLLAGIQLLGYLYILLFILIKYTSYPEEINLVRLLTFGACVGFPPLLLGLIPFYYSRAAKQLTTYLP